MRQPDPLSILPRQQQQIECGVCATFNLLKVQHQLGLTSRPSYPRVERGMWSWSKRWGTLPWEIKGVLRREGLRPQTVVSGLDWLTRSRLGSVSLVMCGDIPHWLALSRVDGCWWVWDSLEELPYELRELTERYRWVYLSVVI